VEQAMDENVENAATILDAQVKDFCAGCTCPNRFCKEHFLRLKKNILY
jgi:hypothetical protein